MRARLFIFKLRLSMTQEETWLPFRSFCVGSQPRAQEHTFTGWYHLRSCKVLRCFGRASHMKHYPLIKNYLCFIVAGLLMFSMSAMAEDSIINSVVISKAKDKQNAYELSISKFQRYNRNQIKCFRSSCFIE